MKPILIKGNISLFVLGACLVALPAMANTITVPYAGFYDESISAPTGDYDAIGGLNDVGLFNLVNGANVFKGSIHTPADSSDFFAIGIGHNQTLIGASIVFGTNLFFMNSPPYSYNYLFAAPGPIWTLEESSSNPTIFLINNIGDNYMTDPKVSNAPSFSRGEGIYGMTIGNGTFATVSDSQALNNGPVDYTMTFYVEESQKNPVPEPSTIVLLGTGIAGLACCRKKMTV